MSVVGRSVCCYLGERPLGTVEEEEGEEERERRELREGWDAEEEEREWDGEEVGRWRGEVEREVGGGMEER